MITRRCTQRQFLLRPDPEVNNAFLYCLAEAAARFQIWVLFTLASSNHHHTGIHDPHGNYPAFLEHFHKLLAKCGNAIRGRWENFWAAEQTSVVRLIEPQDVLDKMIYALTNPVKDHLVERAHHWPGVSSLRAILDDRPVTATRPRSFFRDDGPMPDAVTLKFRRPAGFEHLDHSAWRQLVEDSVARAEREAAEARRTRGGRVLGRATVLRQSWSDRPNSQEPRRGLSPRVAARSKWSRIEALLRNREFIDAYRRARDQLMRGVRDALFPAGS